MARIDYRVCHQSVSAHRAAQPSFGCKIGSRTLEQMANRPFRGVRIVEFGHFAAVSTATAILADWGADVIKVENPKGGDPIRGTRVV